MLNFVSIKERCTEIGTSHQLSNAKEVNDTKTYGYCHFITASKNHALISSSTWFLIMMSCVRSYVPPITYTLMERLMSKSQYE